MPLLALPKLGYAAASLALPGSGEFLLGETTRGATMLGVDIVSLYAFFATNKEIDRQMDNYMQYANIYAGVPLGMPQSQYQAVQDYISSDFFNDRQEMMARNYFLITYYDPAAYAEYLAANTYNGIESWEWQSEAEWNEYKSMRTRVQHTKMSHNLVLGIMLLNRTISAIDSALLSRKNDSAGTVYFSPSGAEGIMLNYQLNF
jgi:hypothetical protein